MSTSCGASLDHRLALRAITNGKAPPALHHELFVGRTAELELFDHDLQLAAAGGATLRFLVGEPGSGKTMLQQIMGERARRRGFVTMAADLSPDRLLHGRNGEGRALLRDAVLAMQTHACSDNSAMDCVVGRFADDCAREADQLQVLIREHLRTKLSVLHVLPKGAEFAKVIETCAFAPEHTRFAINARRWLRGEYSSVAEARGDLGVPALVDDQDSWSLMKLWASFFRLAGRSGLMLLLDEAQVLADAHPSTRSLNFDQLLMIVNQVLQGRAQGLAVVIAATPRFISEWNGIGKHPGLSSCLFEQKANHHGCSERDTMLLHLQPMSEAEVLVLLQRCRKLYAACHPAARLLPDEGLDQFVESCRNGIGDAGWLVPRRILQSFVALHDRLAAYPHLQWQDLLVATGGFEGAATKCDDYAQRQM